MNTQIPPPFVCGMCGTIAGLAFGNCQIYPLWVGAASGASLGCLMTVYLCILNPPIEHTKIIPPEPIDDIIGAPKLTISNTESDAPSK